MARRRAAPARWRVALPALALLLAAAAAQAQWVWRDASGRVTASDRPPPREIAEKDILTRPAPPRPAREGRNGAEAAASAPAAGAGASAAAAATPLAREVEARRKAEETQRTAQAKAEEGKLNAARAENCRRARGHLAALETGQRIARTNERGEREILDDKGRAEELRRAREVIGSDCR